MNRTFYYLGVFFLSLLAAIAVFQNVVFYQLGQQGNSLESILEWYTISSAVNLLTVLILLKYFRFKNYTLSFYAIIAVAIASIGHFIVVYDAFTVKKLSYYFPFTFGLVYGVSILFYLSLVFSRAGERIWLKIMGIIGTLQAMFLLALFVWLIRTPEFQTQSELSLLLSRVSLAGGVIFPVFYLFNFISELRHSSLNQPKTVFQKIFSTILSLAALVALASVLYMGQRISTEAHGLLQWVNRGPEGAEALAKPFEARTYVSAQGDTLRYRLLMPLNYDPEKKYPLAVCLHGGGGWGTDNVKQVEGSWMAQMLSKYMNMKDYPAFVFVPQCPPGSTWGGEIPGVLVDLQSIDALVFECIEALEEELNIDTRRRYVMGASLGGYGTWHFISTRPEKFAAAVPICGGGNPALAENAANTPVWAFHGAKDRSVPVRYSREMIEAIKKAGGDPRYSEYPDQGHIISNQVFNTPELLDWIFAQEREEDGL